MRAIRTGLVAATLIFCLTNTGWSKGELPEALPFAHYDKMVKRSPFAVASADAPVGAKPDFAKDLYVANAAHSPDGDYVTVASTTDRNMKEYLNTRETIHGFTISNIQWSDRVGETKVTITKDGQFATLTFNEALLSQGIQNPAVAQVQPQAQQIPAHLPAVPNGGRTGAPVPGVQRPMAVPQIPTPPPHTRSTIRRRTPTATNTPRPNQMIKPVESEDDDGDFENP